MNKLRFLNLIFLCFVVLPAWGGSSVGGMADNLMNPVGVMSNFVSSACILVGGAFLFSSIIKYVEHRRSPLMVPISTVIFLFIAGLVLILLPLAYMLTENGIPFSLMR